MRKKYQNPPRLAKQLLTRMTAYHESYSIIGDLEEVFYQIYREKGITKSYLWYWSQCVLSLMRYSHLVIKWRMIMLNNYIKIAFRNIFKQKFNSFLNIAGLSLGIASSMMIFFHVQKELSYDKHYPKAAKIFRVTEEDIQQNRTWAATSFPLAIRLKDEIPEIENTARFYYTRTRILSCRTEGGVSKKFEETNGYYADPDVFEMFDFPFIHGEPGNALNQPNSIVLTVSMARKYFGNGNPIGEKIIDDTREWIYLVTGVMEDLSPTTHFEFDYLLSMSTFYSQLREAGQERLLNHTGWNALYTYVLIHESQTTGAISSRLPDFTANFYAHEGSREEILSRTAFRLQPISRIHLHSNIEKEMSPNSSYEYVVIFSVIAILILVIAGVNFINISTAQAMKRFKEVGIRKVMGAQRRQLMRQFLVESTLLTSLSAFMAVLLFKLFLPIYNNLSGNRLAFGQTFSLAFVLLFLFLIILIGIIAGLYPAMFMSTFRPANTLKSFKIPKSSVAHMRKGLVIFQFAISIFMIFSSIIIYMQMVLFRKMDLGFDKEKLVAIKLYGNLQEETGKNSAALKTELLANPAISDITKSNKLLGERVGSSDFIFQDLPEDHGRHNMRGLFVDENYVETLRIELLKGRDFSDITPGSRAFLINETAAELLNGEDPIGLTVRSGLSGNKGPIIGVVKNYNYVSLHNRIEPLLIEYLPEATQYMFIRIRGENIQEILEFIENKVEEMASGHLFIYTFVDDRLDRLYVAEDRTSRIFNCFSLLAIFISCLGLFGLSTYSAELRIKEIGVRKVLGASSSSIVLLLSREFIILVFAANILGLPVAYIVMNKWLQNFAFRIHIGISTFFISGIFALIIALTTVSYRAIRATRTNPVETLRYE